MNNYIQVSIQIKEKEQSEILIALLSEKGFESFEERDEELMAFIKEELYSEDQLKEVTEPSHLEYSVVSIPQQNWNAVWESSFEPVTVGSFANVRAAFHPRGESVKHDIIITPKMSFGTGHHATTYMMIEQMEAIDFTGLNVLDFGTGTAVLAILAEKMGAAQVTAIDNDDWSIENAKENIAENGCTKISIEKAGAIPPLIQYDAILANINLNVILANMEAISKAAKPFARVLLSGFLRNDEEGITQSLLNHKMRHIKTNDRGEWLCINAIAGI